MKRTILMFLVIGATLIFFGCSEKNPSAPELSQSDQVTNTLAKPHLTGTAVTLFTFTPPWFWNGTVDFGNGVEYGLKFFSYDPPRTFSQASPYYEDFYIFDLVDGTIYLKGWNAGVVTLANNPPEPCNFLANGKVEEAYGDFAEWEGRSVHIRGLVYWALDENGVPTGLPERAEGTFRIN